MILKMVFHSFIHSFALIDTIVSILSQALSYNWALIKCNLSGNFIDEEFSKCVEVFSVQDISLRSVNLAKGSFLKLIESFGSNKSLTTIDLDGLKLCIRSLHSFIAQINFYLQD